MNLLYPLSLLSLSRLNSNTTSTAASSHSISARIAALPLLSLSSSLPPPLLLLLLLLSVLPSVPIQEENVKLQPLSHSRRAKTQHSSNGHRNVRRDVRCVNPILFLHSLIFILYLSVILLYYPLSCILYPFLYPIFVFSSISVPPSSLLSFPEAAFKVHRCQ